MSDLTAADFLPEPNFSRPTPDEMAQKIFDENPPEVRNVPSYFERQKDSAFDYVPTRDELRSWTFDVMHDTLGYSPRASRKTAEFLIGTKPGHDRSAMPIPDIGAADFVTGAAAKKFVDPLLMADAQQFRLDDEPGMSTLMAGLAVMPPAAYAAKNAKLSGASDEVLEDTGMLFDESRRGFMKNAGIATLAATIPAPLVKTAKVIMDTPAMVKTAEIASKGAAAIKSLLAKGFLFKVADNIKKDVGLSGKAGKAAMKEAEDMGMVDSFVLKNSEDADWMFKTLHDWNENSIKVFKNIFDNSFGKLSGDEIVVRVPASGTEKGVIDNIIEKSGKAIHKGSRVKGRTDIDLPEEYQGAYDNVIQAYDTAEGTIIKITDNLSGVSDFFVKMKK